MRPRRVRDLARLSLAVAAFCGASPASAQDASAPQAGSGEIRGQTYDGETGAPVSGVAVRLVWPAPAAGGAAREDKQTTAADGGFFFPAVPAGSYDLRFSKEGYRDSELAKFRVLPDRENRADFPLPPLPKAAPSGSSDIEVMVVEASAVEDIMAGLDLRMESDQLLNVMGAEEFSKFAASDVADALKRVSGVNVVQGQFAIIRGLEDRYSSTLYNGAPIPSPDPDSQSVQLDLFPADIVSSVQVAKTFAADQPSNSAGGSIDILTHDYPGEFQFKLNLGSGFNENASDTFLGVVDDSPIGRERDSKDTIESDLGGSFGGRFEWFRREFRYKGVFNHEIDFETREGSQETREPLKGAINQASGRAIRNGDLAFGQLSLSGGAFDLTESEKSKQLTAYGGFGFDLDEGAAHRIDGSVFFTRKDEDTQQLRDNGFIPGVDYAALRQRQLDDLADNGSIDSPIGNGEFICCATPSAWITQIREDAFANPAVGHLWFTNFSASRSFESQRDLLVFQLNGDHRITSVPGLEVTWAANHAKTKQSDSSFGGRFFFEPDDKVTVPANLPSQLADLGTGFFAVRQSGLFVSSADVDEDQWFARLDAEYEDDLTSWLALKLASGGWFERANRDVNSSFLLTPTANTSSQFAIQAATLSELGGSILGELDHTAQGALSGLQEAENDSQREILAWAIEAKATLFEKLEVLGGVRLERIQIESNNDPFTGSTSFDNTPSIFPSKYLFLDRLDNQSRNEVSRPVPPGTTFNDQLLGNPLPINPATGFVDLTSGAEIQSALNGRIDESQILPTAGVNYRPIDGLNLRAAFSKTVARPSFREMGYYVTVEPGSDDLVVGNPNLQLSKVLSWDLRSEYTWGDFGDLGALSVFYKEIDDPIESIVLRDPSDREASSGFRTFLNNPSQAKLVGAELEGRKNLEFLGLDFLEFFSLGANATYIYARVDRTPEELQRSREFFADVPPANASFPRLKSSRRLFGQPEWIANADLTFDQEDWGTKATLSVFAISSVLDAAGSASQAPGGTILDFTLDRYIDSFYQLDFVLSQTWYVELLRGDLTLKFSVKNLSDSTRRIVYDREQTDSRISERSYKIGRDYSFSLGYQF